MMEMQGFRLQARISTVDPFSSDDDLAYLGDIKPGETAVAKFKMTTTKDAIEKYTDLIRDQS